LGREVRIVEKGALDGLTRPEILRLRPEPGDFPLATRLRDGSPVVVGKRTIGPLLKKQLKLMVNRHVLLVALLCTDEFPRLGPQGILLQPGRLLRRSAVSLLRRGKLGVFVPLEAQKEAAERKWRRTGLDLVVAALNPYQEFPQSKEAVKKMRGKKVDLAVLDCIGYSLKTAQNIERLLGRPVLGPRTVLASEISKLIQG
jgi:protein AroM